MKTVKNFLGDTPPGWRKVRNICIIAGLILSWFITTVQTTPGLGVPDVVTLWVGVVLSFTTLLATIAQAQGSGEDPPADKS